MVASVNASASNKVPEEDQAMKELDDLVARVQAAQKTYSTFKQEQVDEIFRTAALAAANARIPLAKMAAEESGMGVVEDKVIKVSRGAWQELFINLCAVAQHLVCFPF